ncbi:MAG: D-alanyl-D-alanine carboxypeptidase [Desulfotignum sp.]|nr:D-alanyl-D-alanine carboxypeptidase [Desulfotignum sp.]
MTHHLQRFLVITAAILTGVMIWFGAVITACGTTVDDPDRLTMLSKMDRAALTQAALNPDTGILVTDDQGRVLFSRQPDTPRVPASILKILTSLAALSNWGKDHRFTTLAGYDSDTRILYIKGLGDPLFVSEVIRDFCGRLTETFRLSEVKKIVIDQTWFAPDISIPGTGRSLNPYDATTGALCANFNTIHFTRDPAAQTFVSAEPQTPLLEMFIPDIRKTGLKQGRILLDTEVRPRYPGLLMAYFLRQLGVDVTGPVETGPFPDPDSKNSGAPNVKTLTLTSPWTLGEVVEKMLKYSNNFIANQVMLTLGAHRYGPPATLEKGVRALADCAADLPGWETARIAEGSGISRQNRITPAQMGQLLLAFMPHHELLRRTATQYYKTGTLTGIRTRAGYFIGTDHRLYPFTCWGQALPF